MEKTEGGNSDGVKKSEGKDRKTELVTCDSDSDGDSDSSGSVLEIVATFAIHEDGHLEVVQQPGPLPQPVLVVQQHPSSSSTTSTQGVASSSTTSTTGGWSSTDENNEWISKRSTEVPVNRSQLKAKHTGRQLKNKKLKKPGV